LAGVEGDRLHHLVGVARGGRHRHGRQASAPTALTKRSTSGNARTVPASFSSSSRFCLRSARPPPAARRPAHPMPSGPARAPLSRGLPATWP
jgi:hypothetical protein